MGKVSLYTTVGTLYTDTRLPFQFRGGGQPNGQYALELSTLIDFIAANPPGVIAASMSGGAGTVSIPDERLVQGFVILAGSGSGTISVGRTVGGTDIFSSEAYDTSSASQEFGCFEYFDAAAPLYFSGFSGTITVKVYTR